MTILTFLAATLLCVGRTKADQPPAPMEDSATVDFPSLRAQALADNPEIAAAKQRWLAAQARPSQRGSLPDPLLSAGYQNKGIDAVQRSGIRFGVEQEMPFPGKLALSEAAAAREADREGALYQAAVLNVVTRLRLTYDDYFLAHKSIDIVRSNTDLLRSLADAAQVRYRVGEGLQQDVARAEVELSILLGRIVALDQACASAAAKLNALLNRPPTATLGKPAAVEKRPLGYTLEELERIAAEKSPALQAAEIEVTRAATNLDLARRQYYPDVVLRADYFDEAAANPEWEVGVGIRLPLYFWRKQAFGVQEAAAGVSEARAGRQSARQDVLARLKDFHAQAVSAERLVELYGDAVIPQAEVSLSSAEAGYQVGKVDSLTLLNSFTVLNDYQLRYYEELTNFDKAVARLEEIAGVSNREAPGGSRP